MYFQTEINIFSARTKIEDIFYRMDVKKKTIIIIVILKYIIDNEDETDMPRNEEVKVELYKMKYLYTH